MLFRWQRQEVLTDPANCGGCGVACPKGRSCKKGECSGASEVCTAGHVYGFCKAGSATAICCPGIGCVDTATDAANCGGCGTACAAGQTCSSGVCGTKKAVAAL